LPAKVGRRAIGREVLVELLRDFFVRFHRLPSSSDFRRRLLPTQGAYAREFGSWGAAIQAAGLGLVAKLPEPGRPRLSPIAG
jgi:hypothetical protein